jgi:hypothetical protein
MGERAAELVVLHPGLRRRFALERRTTIGCREDCDLRLFDPGVEPVHAIIVLEGGEWALRSASYLPCRVNDETVVETVLSDRDVIQIGGVRIGFRSTLLKASNADSAVARSLTALRDDVLAERAMLAEERANWDAELERRRTALAMRERVFRDRAARTARAVQRERERVRRHEKRVLQRAKELDALALKVAEQRKAIDLAKTALRVEERYAGAEFQRLEERRALLNSDANAVAERLAAQKKELLRIDLEIERRRKDLERYVVPWAEAKDRTLIEREIAASSAEREAAEALQALDAMFHEIDDVLARLERRAAAGASAPTIPMLRVANQSDSALETSPPTLLRLSREEADDVQPASLDLVEWAESTKERASTTAWWDAREAEFQQAVRQWRDDKQMLLSELHEKHHAINAARTALSEHEFRVARETARERASIYREREALDRRRSWLDRAQQRYAALQTASLQARLAPTDVDAIPAAEIIARLKAAEELWQQFRCDVLRERMELACERERWLIRDRELANLRRLANKQRTLLAALVADQGVRDRLWNVERRLREAAALERETAIERLALTLLDETRPGRSRQASTRDATRKAA